MKVKFNRKLFNPNFWHLLAAMVKPQWRYIWLYGGSSSAKTYSAVQAILYLTLLEKSDTIVFRKTDASIKKTVYKDFKTIVNKWKLTDYFKVYEGEKIIKCVNGAVIDFGGLDDPEKIKGISQYKRVYCNEISAFELHDFKQIRKRLRGKLGQQVICDFNPIDETHWIKEEIFDKTDKIQLQVTLSDAPVKPAYTEVTDKWSNSSQTIPLASGGQKEIEPNMLVIRSTYLNNYWVVGSPCGTFGFQDIQTIADFESDKSTDYNFYKIYALGEWGRLTKGGEFYKSFDPARQVVPQIEYNPEMPLHISFDENVHPYVSLSVYQAEGSRAWKIDEICLKSPNNTLAFTLREFIRRYPVNKSGLFIYGDRTSLKSDTKLEFGQNFYTIVAATLNAYSPSIRLPSKNPPVAMRGNFINQVIFGKNMYVISDNCKNTITDYLYVKEAADGTKSKEKTKDPVTKVSYEKWGHLSDTDDYFLCQYFSKEFYSFQAGGVTRKVITG